MRCLTPSRLALQPHSPQRVSASATAAPEKCLCATTVAGTTVMTVPQRMHRKRGHNTRCSTGAPPGLRGPSCRRHTCPCPCTHMRPPTYVPLPHPRQRRGLATSTGGGHDSTWLPTRTTLETPACSCICARGGAWCPGVGPCRPWAARARSRSSNSALLEPPLYTRLLRLPRTHGGGRRTPDLNTPLPPPSRTTPLAELVDGLIPLYHQPVRSILPRQASSWVLGNSWRKFAGYLGVAAKRFERYRNVYVVIARDGTIITVCWRH
jgi:hypothetical protein